MPSTLQAVEWALRPLSFLDRCHEHYGDVFTLRVRRGRPWVFITRPQDIKQVFTTAADLMAAGAGEANPLLGPLLGARSVILLDEPQHLADRKRLLPSFHNARMKVYGEMIADVARKEIARWPIGEPFALWPRMQAISLEVVMRAVFGSIDGQRLEVLRRQLVTLTAWVNNPRRLALLAALGPRSLTASAAFRRVMAPVEETVLEEVACRRGGGARTYQEGEQEDILSMLERAYGEGGEAMSHQKLRDELVTLLSDGPTSTSLAWAFERLLRHPDKLERLRDEVDEGGDEAYLDAVVKETLRLCPTVPVVMRRLLAPMRIGGYEIPSDTVIAPCVYLTHRRADIYPQPLVFRPERFLEQPAGTYTWIPFGGGIRRCVAVVFAQLEMKRVMQAVLSEVDLKPVRAPSERAARSSVSFAPDKGALVIATRRTHRAHG